MSAPKASKSDLVEKVRLTLGVRNEQAIDAVQATLDGIAELAASNKLILRGFGTFEMKTRAARTGRNPQTGLPVDIPASSSLTFKAAKPKA